MGFSNVDLQLKIALNDLNPNFIEALAVATAWEYSTLYEEIASEPDLPEQLRLEQFANRRGYAVANALKRTAFLHGIPYDFRRLECNGQRKLVVKSGRIILIQEPILTLIDHPKASDYKVELANLHGLMCQTELDLGDHRRRIQDWSGCVLGVLLHGAAGPNFTAEHRMLGGLMFGITDSSYNQWVARIDLHKIAMYGRGKLTEEQIIAQPLGPFVPDQTFTQPDHVIVTPKKKKSDKGSA